MSDINAQDNELPTADKWSDPEVIAHNKKRHAAERRFKAYGITALVFAGGFLLILFASIISTGWSAFIQSSFKLEVDFSKEILVPDGKMDEQSLRLANWNKVARNALYDALAVDATSRSEKRSANKLLSRSIDGQLLKMVLDDPGLIGQKHNVWLLASGDVDAMLKGHIDRNLPQKRRQVNDQQLAWIDAAREKGILQKHFNTGLFKFGASSQPESAGLAVALVGSFFMMMTVVLMAVPIGVAAAIYLEEFAPRNKFTDLIEVNINNLAAVPSIVFGLLGLGVFINFFGLPRSAALVAGLVLSLMTLPTIIIASRAALTAVPPSIRDGALGVGASKMQSIFHHVLPLAIPGIMTGTIIGLVQALGETAPLLMIGLVAFVVDVPTSPMEPTTALPVQIYMWASSAERGFVERTAGATMVLLMFLLVMNSVAVILRKRFEKRW